MILVVGGTGRLGTLVARRLVDDGRPVRVLTRDRARAAHLPDAVEVVTGDVRDPAAVHRAVAGVTTVVGAAHGFAGVERGALAAVDRAGNGCLVDAAAGTGADVVLVSTVGAAAAHPLELFRMKHAAEEHLRASPVAGTIVRSTAFLELWIEILRTTAGSSGRPLVFGRGENPINFVSVADVADVVVGAVGDPSSRGATLEVGGPEDLTFRQLAAAVQRADGRTGPPRCVPRPVLHAMAAALALGRPALARQIRAALVMDRIDLTFAAASTAGSAAHPARPARTLTDVLAVAPPI